MLQDKLLTLLVCPKTQQPLEPHNDELWSRQAKLAFPIIDGIPALLIDEARALSEEELAL